jgi:hypothetical protein
MAPEPGGSGAALVGSPGTGGADSGRARDLRVRAGATDRPVPGMSARVGLASPGSVSRWTMKISENERHGKNVEGF